MAVIGVNYTDGLKKGTLEYVSVDLSFGSPIEVKVFESGNFIKDWYYMRKFLIQKVLDHEPYASASSSVDHFIMDGAPYDSGYLIYDEGLAKHVLKYGNEFAFDGIEFFVPEGTQPTWEELKKMCES
ncbi:MAG: hypothetical protein WC333_00270 [Dehalococcoidia bacterium]|jgi:hypothetical protein